MLVYRSVEIMSNGHHLYYFITDDNKVYVGFVNDFERAQNQ